MPYSNSDCLAILKVKARRLRQKSLCFHLVKSNYESKGFLSEKFKKCVKYENILYELLNFRFADIHV